MSAIALRVDNDAGQLRELARRIKNAKQVRRLFSLAAVYDRAARGQAAASRPPSPKWRDKRG